MNTDMKHHGFTPMVSLGASAKSRRSLNPRRYRREVSALNSPFPPKARPRQLLLAGIHDFTVVVCWRRRIKRVLTGFVCILCFLLNVHILMAAQDKIESSLDFKKITQSTPVVPPIPQTIPLPVNNNPDLAVQTITPPLPTIQPTTPSLNSTAPIPPPMKNIADIKKPNISVPDFEKKYRELFEAEQMKKAMKKKSLIDSILDEIVRYGILITLGLVILIVIYTIKKDKDMIPKAPPSETPKEEEKQKTEEKKDIWKEDF